MMIVKDLNFLSVWLFFRKFICDLVGNYEEGGSSVFVIFIYIVFCYIYIMYLLYVFLKDD